MKSMDVSVMNTATTTVDDECFNGLHDLFMLFDDATDIIQIDRIKIEHVSSILLVCVADAAECLVRCHDGSVEFVEYVYHLRIACCHMPLPLSLSQALLL